jgi:hypothetical protein
MVNEAIIYVEPMVIPYQDKKSTEQVDACDGDKTGVLRSMTISSSALIPTLTIQWSAYSQAAAFLVIRHMRGDSKLSDIRGEKHKRADFISNENSTSCAGVSFA